MSEGDGEDDDQEERLSQQQAGMFCVCCDVMPVLCEAPELFREKAVYRYNLKLSPLSYFQDLP